MKENFIFSVYVNKNHVFLEMKNDWTYATIPERSEGINKLAPASALVSWEIFWAKRENFSIYINARASAQHI